MSHHSDNEFESTSSTGSTNPYSRRLFMQQGMAFLSMATTVPLFMQRSAQGIMIPLGSLVSSQAGVPEDHTLVVIQLGGGNDGLNTVIPYGDRSYYKNRPQLAISAPGKSSNGSGTALPIPGADGFGLHPNLTGLLELIDDGQAAIIQGVGYPNPNRSHFTSTVGKDMVGLVNISITRVQENQIQMAPLQSETKPRLRSLVKLKKP